MNNSFLRTPISARCTVSLLMKPFFIDVVCCYDRVVYCLNVSFSYQWSLNKFFVCSVGCNNVIYSISHIITDFQIYQPLWVNSSAALLLILFFPLKYLILLLMNNLRCEVDLSRFVLQRFLSFCERKQYFGEGQNRFITKRRLSCIEEYYNIIVQSKYLTNTKSKIYEQV